MKRAVMSVLLLVATAASAQGEASEPMPRGPAEVIGGAQSARRQREMKQAVEAGEAERAEQAEQAEPAQVPADQDQPAGADASGPSPAASAVNPHAVMEGDGRRALSSARVDPELPAGTVRVRVVDALDAPVPDSPVVLGVMKADGKRSELEQTTDDQGHATFSDLDVGARQAYRANVPHAGARFSSNPFRLPQNGGYDVMVRRLPVTRDDSDIVLYVGATSLELKDERLKVVQQVRFYNIGAEAYVFPEEGQLLRLPEGFLAVQSEETMTDQRIVEAPEGLRIHGSLLPGEVTLLWGFDLPLSGTEMSFELPIPWRTFAYRVVADAPAGLELSVDGFPKATEHEDRGRRFFVTELQRRVGDPPFNALTIHLEGIPGPGLGRWIAVLLTLCAIGIGAVASRRPSSQAKAAQEAGLEQRKQALLERARELQARRDAGELGPEYHKEQKEALVEELSLLLLQEARGGTPPRGGARAS